jgi:hypothetical protein
MLIYLILVKIEEFSSKIMLWFHNFHKKIIKISFFALCKSKLISTNGSQPIFLVRLSKKHKVHCQPGGLQPVFWFLWFSRFLCRCPSGRLIGDQFHCSRRISAGLCWFTDGNYHQRVSVKRCSVNRFYPATIS